MPKSKKASIQNPGSSSTLKSRKRSTTNSKSPKISKYFSTSKDSDQSIESPYKKLLSNSDKIAPIKSNNDEDDFRSPKPIRIAKVFNLGSKTTAIKPEKPKRKPRSINKKDTKKNTNTITKLLSKITEDQFPQNDVNPEHLQMALALSKSEVSEEIENCDESPLSSQEKHERLRSALQQFGFNMPSGSSSRTCRNVTLETKKRKKSKFQYITPLLLSRMDEERYALISAKVSSVLIAMAEVNHEENTPVELHSEDLRHMYSQTCHIFRKNGICLENDQYFVSSLNIPHCEYSPGCLLKKWNSISGRDTSPERASIIITNQTFNLDSVNNVKSTSKEVDQPHSANLLQASGIIEIDCDAEQLHDMSPERAPIIRTDQKDSEFCQNNDPASLLEALKNTSKVMDESSSANLEQTSDIIEIDSDTEQLHDKSPESVRIIRSYHKESQDCQNNDSSSLLETLKTRSKDIEESPSANLNQTSDNIEIDSDTKLLHDKFLERALIIRTDQKDSPDCRNNDSSSLLETLKTTSKDKESPSANLGRTSEIIEIHSDAEQLRDSSNEGFDFSSNPSQLEVNEKVDCQSPNLNECAKPNDILAMTTSRKSIFDTPKLVPAESDLLSPELFCTDDEEETANQSGENMHQISTSSITHESVINITLSQFDKHKQLSREQDLRNSKLQQLLGANFSSIDNLQKNTDHQHNLNVSVTPVKVNSYNEKWNDEPVDLTLTDSDNDDNMIQDIKDQTSSLQSKFKRFSSFNSTTSIDSNASEVSIVISDEELNYSTVHSVKPSRKKIRNSCTTKESTYMNVSSILKELTDSRLCNLEDTVSKISNSNVHDRQDNVTLNVDQSVDISSDDDCIQNNVQDLKEKYLINEKSTTNINLKSNCAQQQLFQDNNCNSKNIVKNCIEPSEKLSNSAAKLIEFKSIGEQNDKMLAKDSSNFNFHDSFDQLVNSTSLLNRLETKHASKVTTPTHIIETPDNSFIIKTDNITPMPEYLDMDTPKIAGELRKFGLKPLKRKKGVQLLQYLYDATHPKVATEKQIDSNSDDDTGKVVKKQRNRSPKKSRNAVVSVPTEPIEIVGDIINEAEYTDLIFERKRSVRISSCPCPLNIAWYNLLVANPDIRERMLLYEPLEVEPLYAMLKAQGFKYNIKDVITFFDRKCITIRMKGKTGRRK